MKAMSKEQFIDYAQDALSVEALECLYERIDEHNGEVARFGDSWPGAIPQLNESITEVKSIERQLARILGRPERDFKFRVRSPQ